MIGIIAASEDELQPILDAMSIIKKITKALVEFNIGKIGDKDVVASFSGVCKVNAAIAIQTMIDLYNPVIIYITGVAGALDQQYSIGDTIIVKKVAHHDVNPEILTEYHPFMNSIWYTLHNINENTDYGENVYVDNIVSGEKFINPENKKEISTELNVHCVDMESAAFAQVCYAHRIPLVIVKTITDNTDDKGHENFEKNVVYCSKICALKVLELIQES